MSDDPNEFRVTDIRWVNDLPVPEGYDIKPGDFIKAPPAITCTLTEDVRIRDDIRLIEVRDEDVIQSDAFKTWITDQLGFPDRIYFWTSSRGDHWEKIEADSAETAAIIQAERWNQKGYRGPFTIMVSVSGLEQPPKSGDKVTTFDLVPEVIFRAHKLEFKKLD